ncbi:unnamed protein product [Moneuplotes crassus]|uniref:AP2/ERF domain-containing protein n=1 Tax=Euplotes crassus TaxID=5936 RepID=A0AAD2D686_EUPCR|nr:unnamed protein product [Moneuplotes crassus]
MFTCSPSRIQLDLLLHHQILFMNNQYCLCPGSSEGCTEDILSPNIKSDKVVTKQSSRIIKSRKANKLLKSRNTEKGLAILQRILQSYDGKDEVVVKRFPKSKTTSQIFKSGRRSSYIGVSKNGDVWQALIMIDSKKTYIGTYHKEKEAAMAYDFYSIILKQLAAKTNFDYTLSMIKRMVYNYYENGQEFIPADCM